MARKKLSEFRAKTLLASAFGQDYHGISLDLQANWLPAVKRLSTSHRYVVKVDEGVKGRFKKGLVHLNQTAHEVAARVRELGRQDFRYVIVEPQLEHEPNAERYLAVERQRVGNMVMFSMRGGIEIENHGSEVRRQNLTPSSDHVIEDQLGLAGGTLRRLNELFDEAYCSFLEINPLVVTGGQLHFLDAAIEVDEEAATLVNQRWAAADFRDYPGRKRLPQELAVAELAAQSSSSFRLEVLNPDGRIFLLLSGGGASIVLADEVNNLGQGRQLGNYGEYSGNPTEEETYRYTLQVVDLMLGSAARDKILIIGGGVANFTDIRATFKGVIRALGERAKNLQRQGIKVYVRRGGPHEVEGLALIEQFLNGAGLLGRVAGPELMLTDIIAASLKKTTGGRPKHA